ncbi:MAG: sodium:solute symporter family protein [Pseudomonadota bacterium]
MDQFTLNLLFVGGSFALYIGIAIWARAGSTSEFYAAGRGVHPVTNGMATAADWMSAASFISMAGLIAFTGYDNSSFLMGWTGGYVLLALLLAPYLRKFGKFTVPDFVGDRYYSGTARVVAIVCAIFISFTYVCGQMQGVGIVFARFLKVDVNLGVAIGMLIVFFYAVMGGMKGITYTQVAQYCVLIFAFMVPAFFISFQFAGNPVPQLGFGGEYKDSGEFILDRLDGLTEQLGFTPYTSGGLSTINLFCITAALMFGTAGLPHVIVRFYTVKKVKAARTSAFWALLFIAILYTAAPAVSVFARTNMIDTISGTAYKDAPSWFKNWEETGLVAWLDKDGDGRINYRSGTPFEVSPGDTKLKPKFELTEGKRGPHGQRLVLNAPTDNENELLVDRDIMVLANPEIAGLPTWVIGLVAAGGLAAALSTAAGLLLVISTAFAHDLVKKTFKPELSDKDELKLARIGAGVAVVIAGYFGMNPPGFVAQVVAFAFGLAASSFFPAIILGIFSKRVTKEGAISGMIVGIAFTALYIVYFKFINPSANSSENWLLGISPEGIGTVGMVLNLVVTLVITKFTPPPPDEVRRMVERIRLPE